LEYSTDGGATYPNVIATLLDASTATPYAWNIPDNLSSTARARVTNEADSTVFDISNADFTIKGSLAVTSPNGAEAWMVGSTRILLGAKTGSIANIKIEYSTNSGTTYPNTITASAAASSLNYPWTIPDSIGNQLKIKITDLANNFVYDESDADFRIKGSVVLISPNGGETWRVGESQSIAWSKTGSFANVKLEYSTNGFSDELQNTVITSSTLAGPLSYNWTVPDAISTTIKVRISDVNDSTVVDISNANFTIKGSLALSSPNGGEVWITGQSQDIVWSRTGSITNVSLNIQLMED